MKEPNTNMSSEAKDIYAKSMLATFRPVISFIVVPLGFIMEFLIEAPFLIFLMVDKLLRKRK